METESENEGYDITERSGGIAISLEEPLPSKRQERNPSISEFVTLIQDRSRIKFDEEFLRTLSLSSESVECVSINQDPKKLQLRGGSAHNVTFLDFELGISGGKTVNVPCVIKKHLKNIKEIEEEKDMIFISSFQP